MTNALYEKRSSRVKLFVRITTDLLFVVLVVVAPWWVVLTVGLLLMLRLGSYELVLCGLFMDALFATGNPSFLAGEFIFTTSFLVAMTIIYFAHRGAKNYLKF